jgi:diacylglycerol kinase (ATP)
VGERLFVKDTSWRARFVCFAHASRGIAVHLATQANAQIHALATIGAVLVGLWLGLSSSEWALIAGAIGLVWVAETFNTAVEFLVDLVSPAYHPLAGRVKDVAAGAVLLAATTAAVIGLLIFGPKLLALWRG